MDPTQPLPARPASTSARAPDNHLSSLMDRQLEIAGILQNALIRDQNSLTSRELRDLSSSASTLIGLSHRTDQVSATLKTYQTFVSVVLEFLRERSDALGEDLLAEIRRVGQEMKADAEVGLILEG